VGQNVSEELISALHAFQAEYIRLSTSDTVVGEYPQILGLHTRSPQRPVVRNKWPLIVQDLNPIPFELGFENEYTKDDEFLKGISKNEVNPELWGAQEPLMKLVSRVHDSAHPVNSLATIRAALGDEVFTNLTSARMLSWYIMVYHDKREPYIWQSGLESVDHDNLAPKRILLLMNAMLYEASSVLNGDVPHDVFEEILRFMVRNPVINAREMKGLMELHQLSFGCLTEQGEYPKWDPISLETARPVLGSYERGVANGVNDSIWYERSAAALKEAEDKMVIAGLVKTASYLRSMLSMPWSASFIRQISAMHGVTHLTGYTRSNAPISHFKQTSMKSEIEVPGHASQLKQTWREFADWVYDPSEQPRGIGFMSMDELRRSTPAFLTNKSSGGFKVVFEVVTKGGRFENTYAFRQTDKNSVYLNNPELAWRRLHIEAQYKFVDLDGKVVSNEEVLEMEGKSTDEIREWLTNRGLDASQVLKFAERVVTGGKQSRAINPRRLAHHIAEAPLFVKMAEYFNRDDQAYQPHGTAHDYTLNGATGNDGIDHAKGIYVTSDERYINAAQDFSAFDGTQHYNNMRRWALEGLTEGMIAHHAYGPDGEWEQGYLDVLRRIWGEGTSVNTHAISDNGVSVRVVVLDILGSGEFNTLHINNMSNYGNFRYAQELISTTDIPKKMRILGLQIVGDDRNTIYEVRPGYDLDTLSEFLDLNEKAATSSDFSLNTQKSVTRRDFYEYLKVHAIKGYRYAAPSVQLFETENRPDVNDPITDAKAYASKAIVVASRLGLDFELNVMCMIRFMIRSEYRMRNFSGGKNPQREKYYVYAGAYFSPEGAGQVPFSLTANSKTAYIAAMAYKDRSIQEIVEKADYILDLKTNTAGKIADAIAQGKTTYQTDPRTKRRIQKDVYELGKREIRQLFMTPDRLSASKNAIETLEREKKISVPPSMQFAEYDRNQVKSTARANRSISRQNSVTTTESGYELLKRAEQAQRDGRRFLRDRFGFLDTVDFVMGGELSQVMPLRQDGTILYYAPRHDQRIQYVVSHFGVRGPSAIAKFSPARFIGKLLRLDPLGPRRIITEEMFLDLISDAALSHDADGITLLFISMGYAADASAVVAADIINNMDAFAVSESVRGYGFSSKEMEMLDRSAANVNRIVTLPVNHPDARVSNLYTEIAYFIAYMEAVRTGVPRSISIETKAGFLATVDRALYKKPRRASARVTSPLIFANSLTSIMANLHDTE
jgi:hypothetical protein